MGKKAQTPVGAAMEEADEYRALQGRLIRLYELQARVLAQMQVIEASTDKLRQQMAAWKGFAESPPYALDLGDGLWQEVRNAEQDIQTMRLALRVFEKDLSDAKEFLKSATFAMRQSAERLIDLNHAEHTSRPRWLLGLNQLRVHVAEVEVATQEINRRMANLRIAAKEVEHAFLVKKLDEANAHVHFSRQDLNSKIDQLEQEQLDLQKEILLAKRNDRAFYTAEPPVPKRLGLTGRKEQSSPDRMPETAGEEGRLEQFTDPAAAEIEAMAYQRRALSEAEQVIDKTKTVWKERFVLMNSPSTATQAPLLTYLRAEQNRTEQQQKILLSLQTASQKKLAYQQSLQKEPSWKGTDREQSRKLSAAYLQQVNAWIPLQARLIELNALLERTIREVERRRAKLPIKDRSLLLVSRMAEAASQLANFEIYSVKDTITVEGKEISGTRRVTMGQLSLFLLIITAGFWLSARAVYFGQRGLKYLLKLNVDSSALFARIAHIILVLGVAAVALNTMKIPLAVFAFLGGAMALAIGFGAQNLLNNFVSGLILLIERPIKTGDIVDVEGVTGRITQIGVRCCEIRRMDGIEMLVPNSAMIEKTVTNWTLSDQKRRASVKISIAYGVPVDQTLDLIEAAVRSHSNVLVDPAPQVLLEEFGESALVFTVYYWLDLAQVTDRLVVASQIRVSLYRRLTEAGIPIAYPQCDVHLHNGRPLEIAIVNSAAEFSGSTNDFRNAKLL